MRLLIVSLFIVIAAGAATAEDVKSALMNGDELHARFENAKALEEYKKAFEADPENFVATVKMFRAFVDTGVDID